MDPHTVSACLHFDEFELDEADASCASTSPQTCVGTHIPLFAWSSPWKVLGAKVAFATAPATLVYVDTSDTFNEFGFFNPFVGSTFNWDLGGGWGFTYLLGAYLEIDSASAYSSTSLNQRLGLSYTANGWNLTANVIWGVNFDQTNAGPQGSPCPTAPQFACNPDFLNIDLTATKKSGKWESGAIGFHSSDISTPISGYQTQSKAAMRGLVAYWFGPVIWQMYVTTEVYEETTAARTRAYGRASWFPLGHSPGRGHWPIAQ